MDALFSYVPVYRRAFGGRWYNVVLGLALLGLTWFDIENEPGIHYPAAWVFFLLFIAVTAYTSALGWRGRHIEQPGNSHNRQLEIITAQVSLVFLGLLALSLLAWLTGLITFLFLRDVCSRELFALLHSGVSKAVSVHSLRVREQAVESTAQVLLHNEATVLS